eukprot:jgi/Psemu1/299275/fgenesh1_pm.1129_\
MTDNHESTAYVFEPPPVSSLPIVGTSKKFPVRRVYCVGKNYVEHVIEMGGDVKRNKPIFFTKPSVDGVVFAGLGRDGDGDHEIKPPTPIEYPPNTNNLHYEVELVVAIGKELGSSSNSNSSNDATETPPPELLECVFGYAVGIDLTRRDLQDEAKSKRWPWDTGKYFDQSAPIGPITPRAASEAYSFADELNAKTMALTVNGTIRQSAKLETMIWKVPEIISELSKSFRLKPGDLIMTGTPSGVGPVVAGDRLVGTIDGLVEPVDIVLI